MYLYFHIFATMKISLDKMEENAAEAERLLKALANRHRLLILCQLAGGEKSVGELGQALNLRPPAVSQHLALLRADGLVQTRRDGQTIWYSIANGPAAKMIETLHRIYCA